MGKTDENEFLDSCSVGSLDQAFHITDIGFRQECLRPRGEEDSGKMHNAVNMVTRIVQDQRFGEIRFPNGDLRVG
jgi:hypothetical protein